MQSIVNHLNAVIEDRMPVPLKPGPARLALQAIETQKLCVTALRTLLIPGMSVESKLAAVKHAQDLIELLDKEVARIEASAVASRKMPEPPADASDLA